MFRFSSQQDVILYRLMVFFHVNELQANLLVLQMARHMYLQLQMYTVLACKMK